MRNLAEQKRVFTAVLLRSFMAFFWIIIVVLFFLFNMIPVASITGYKILPYSSTEAAGSYKKGDLIIYTPTLPAAPEGTLFSYYTEGQNAEGKSVKITHNMIYAGSYQQEETIEVNGESVTATKTHYIVKASQNGSVSYVHEDEIFGEGWSVFRLGYVGYAAIYLNYSLLISIFSLIALSILFFLPSIFVMKRAVYATDLDFWHLILMLPLFEVLIVLSYRKRYNVLASPFAEGIDTTNMKKENYYIISELRHFFKKGKFQFVKGHDCYKVYIPIESKRVLFATVLMVNKHIQVLIHTDMKRWDGRIERSNFINIYNAVELPDIKKEIVRIFRENVKPKLPQTNY